MLLTLNRFKKKGKRCRKHTVYNVIVISILYIGRSCFMIMKKRYAYYAYMYSCMHNPNFNLI